MVSEAKVAAFLKLQQQALDIEDSTKLLEQFLPIALQELNLVGYPYVFLSSIFIDADQNVKQIFFIDKSNWSGGEVTKGENLFQKGSEWEMKVMYGEATVVSDIGYFINSEYPQFQNIRSLLILPIQQRKQLTGVLVLASSKQADKIDAEEIEFTGMVARLIDLAFRLQDTERSSIKITQRVYEMNAKLNQLDKLKDDFVSVASHELRTPMTAIRSYVWMALHRSDIPLSQKLERYLYRTLVSTERLIKLVNDMLNVSRIEAGRIEINPQEFDIVSLVKEVAEEVKAKADEKRLQLLVLEHKVSPIFADPDKVHQILLNLIGNCLKFSYPGGIITIDFFTDGKMVEISVKDTGSGIARDDLSRLFRKFSRLDNSYTAISTSGGTGLGLYISKSLVELMHGKIWANSEGIDHGSTFAFSLPIANQQILEHTKDFVVKATGDAKELEPVVL